MCGEHVQLEMPVGIQTQMVSSWQHVGLRSEEEIEETQNTGRVGALRERVTGSREERGMSIGWPWTLEEEQPAD